MLFETITLCNTLKSGRAVKHLLTLNHKRLVKALYVKLECQGGEIRHPHTPESVLVKDVEFILKALSCFPILKTLILDFEVEDNGASLSLSDFGLRKTAYNVIESAKTRKVAENVLTWVSNFMRSYVFDSI